MLKYYLELNNVRIGAEIKMDEYVPINIPTNTRTLKLLIASPPSNIKAKLASKVVNTVIVVLDSVSLTLKLITSTPFARNSAALDVMANVADGCILFILFANIEIIL